jgi:5-methylcytosine-specific restriction enzyme subunit McrC
MISYIYGLDLFRKEYFAYQNQKEEIIFERLIWNLLSRVEELCRRGISKSYYENEENLPYLRGKILMKGNLGHNLVFKHRMYCQYSEFGPDTAQNQVIKYTLYRLSKMIFEDSNIHRKIRLLLHYFESVSLRPSYQFAFPNITYTRLTKHYQPLINLCRLLLLRSSFNLGYKGKTSFSSFLIDMNVIFESFIAELLKHKLKPKALRVKGMKHKETSFSDVQSRTRMFPDIVIKKGQRLLLILDAKYKDSIADDDLNQIWIYCIAWSLRTGILIYPKHMVTVDETRTLKQLGTEAIIKNIDLKKDSLEDFEKECDRFAEEIAILLRSYEINIDRDKMVKRM